MKIRNVERLEIRVLGGKQRRKMWFGAMDFDPREFYERSNAAPEVQVRRGGFILQIGQVVSLGEFGRKPDCLR